MADLQTVKQDREALCFCQLQNDLVLTEPVRRRLR